MSLCIFWFPSGNKYFWDRKEGERERKRERREREIERDRDRERGREKERETEKKKDIERMKENSVVTFCFLLF